MFNANRYKYRGVLVLFPIDFKYQNIIEKYFNIFKKIEIKGNKLDKLLENIFEFEINYPRNLIKSKSIENSKGEICTIYLIIDRNTNFVNEKKKKLTRREIDNLRYIETNVYRKNLPLQNHFHTTDCQESAIKIINYIYNSNYINSEDKLKCINFLENKNDYLNEIIINDLNLLEFNKVIIWGHKLHSHTHSYIHEGFYKAFKYLGYDVYWLDNNDNIDNINFSNSLFLTEHQVNSKIPIRQDCKYILHNCYVDEGKAYYKKNAGLWEDKRYITLAEQGNVVNMQVYRPNFVKNKKKMDEYIYYSESNYTLYMPWGTNLLPYEIECNKDKLINWKRSRNKVNLIGSFDGDYKTNWINFIKALNKEKIKFNSVGGFRNNISSDENYKLIMESYISPAIQIEQQLEVGYIPCRIFKNISYGQLGITNSKVVSELFNNKIIFNKDTYQLFYDSEFFLKNKYNLEYQFKMMDFVKNKHTYLNRIESIFKLFILLNKKS
jgi:hypothetical protein